jgi:LCP family protein required for cell wall assembly
MQPARDRRPMSPHESNTRPSRLDPKKFGRTPGAPPKAEKTTRAVEYILFAVVGVLLVVGGIALYSSFSPSYRQVPNLVDDGIKQDRLNILLIGVGGDSHKVRGKDQGADLADSVIIASLKPSTRQVALISVPRDLYVPVGRYGKHRINLAHALGNVNGYPGLGAGLLVDTISKLFEQPIHGFARVDFAAFREIIDSLGGIQVDVPHRIHDELFNDSFEPGLQTMSGERALLYTRYRFIRGVEGEGDNFGREVRQQQVIDAIRTRLQQQGPEDVLKLVSTARSLSRHTETNLSTSQMLWLYRTFRNAKGDDMRKISLKPYMQYIRIKFPPSEAGSAVQPWNGDFGPLRQIARDPFAATQPPPPVKVASTPSRAAAVR